jgi:hypothetical protein
VARGGTRGTGHEAEDRRNEVRGGRQEERGVRREMGQEA